MNLIVENPSSFTGININLLLILRVICTFLIQGKKHRWGVWFCKIVILSFSAFVEWLISTSLPWLPLLGFSSDCDTDPYCLVTYFVLRKYHLLIKKAIWEWNLNFYTSQLLHFLKSPQTKTSAASVSCWIHPADCWVVMMFKLKVILNTWCLPGFTESGVISYMLFSCSFLLSLFCFMYHCLFRGTIPSLIYNKLCSHWIRPAG